MCKMALFSYNRIQIPLRHMRRQHRRTGNQRKSIGNLKPVSKKKIPKNLEPIQPCQCESHEIIKSLNPKLIQTVQGKSTLFYVQCPICGLDTILYKKAEHAVYEWNHYFAKDSQGDLLELQERRNKINKEKTNR